MKSIAILIFLPVLSLAQSKPGTGTGTGSGTGNSPITLPTTKIPTTTNPTQQQDTTQMSRTAYIIGKVMMDDGTPPPESVVIERICGSTRRAEARTDSKGHFSFQVGGLGQTQSIVDSTSDASWSPSQGSMNSTGGLGSTSSNARSGGFNDATNLRGCELKAVLPGYRSSSFNLFSQSSIGAIDVGTLLLKRLGGREGDTISMVNAMAPNGAKKAFEKGKQQLAKGNVADARVEFSKAVETYPKYAAAWVELGRLQASLKENNEARQSFQKALEADPKYLPPYDQLSMIAYREQKWQELADTTSRLIQLNAYDFPQTYFFNAIANVNINKPDPAIKSAREALKADPQKFIRAQYVIGMALAQKGEFAASAEQLKSYLATNPQEAEAVKKRLTEIEKLATETTAARLDKEPQ